MGSREPRGIAGLALGKILSSIDKGMTASRHIAGENTDLAVRDLARRSGVLALVTVRCLALLEKSGLIDEQSRIVCGEVFDNIIPHDVAQGLRVPPPTAQNGLLPPRSWITGLLTMETY